MNFGTFAKGIIGSDSLEKARLSHTDLVNCYGKGWFFENAELYQIPCPLGPSDVHIYRLVSDFTVPFIDSELLYMAQIHKHTLAANSSKLAS